MGPVIVGLLLLVGIIVVAGLTGLGAYGLWAVLVDNSARQSRDLQRLEAERRIDDIAQQAQTAIISEAVRRHLNRDLTDRDS